MTLSNKPPKQGSIAPQSKDSSAENLFPTISLVELRALGIPTEPALIISPVPRAASQDSQTMSPAPMQTSSTAQTEPPKRLEDDQTEEQVNGDLD